MASNFLPGASCEEPGCAHARLLATIAEGFIREAIDAGHTGGIVRWDTIPTLIDEQRRVLGQALEALKEANASMQHPPVPQTKLEKVIENLILGPDVAKKQPGDVVYLHEVESSVDWKAHAKAVTDENIFLTSQLRVAKRHIERLERRLRDKEG